MHKFAACLCLGVEVGRHGTVCHGFSGRSSFVIRLLNLFHLLNLEVELVVVISGCKLAARSNCDRLMGDGGSVAVLVEHSARAPRSSSFLYI